MAETDINIVLRLSDKLTAGLTNVSRSMQTFGQTVERTGAHISRLGTSAIFLGASISGPLLLAMHNAATFTPEVNRQFQELGNIMEHIQGTIANDLAPVMEGFINVVSNLASAFINLNPQLRESVLQWTLISGILLTTSGIILKLLGNLMKLGGALMVIVSMIKPWGWALMGVGAATGFVIAQWEKLRGVVMPILGGIQKVMDPMGMWKAPLEAASKGMDKISSAVQSTNKKVIDSVTSVTKKGTDDMKKNISDAYRQIVQITQKTADAMASTMSNVFFDAFTGQLKSAKEYFADFGRSILRIMTDMVAKMAVNWMMFGSPYGSAEKISGGLMGLFSTQHTGGSVRRAHSGTMASDEVPLIAQIGEGVISRQGMRALGSEGFGRLNRGQGGGGGGMSPVIVIQAWDARDVYRNRKIISQSLIDEMRKNGDFRTAVREYR